MEDKLLLFKNIEIFNTLNSEELEFLAGSSEFLYYKKNAVIFEKGNSSNYLYIIKKGEVRITNITGAQKEEAIAFFIENNIFGEYDLFEGDLHPAYALANTDTRLLVFPVRDTQFKKLYKSRPELFGKIYYNLISQNAGRIRKTNKIVSEKTQWVEDLKNQMYCDKLTNFFNRAYLDNEVSENLSNLGNKAAFTVVKPDNFKMINDTFGHEAGDSALRMISACVHQNIGESDIPVRFRGNEFIVISPGISLDTALEKAEKLHRILSNLDIGKQIQNKSLKLTFSMGIAGCPEHSQEREDLIEKAYAKLFEQRENGGNGILIADKEEQENIRFLKSIAIFSSLYIHELKVIASYLKPMDIKKGDIICKEGDEGKELFLIESGKATILINLEDGAQKEIAEISSGDFFGEMAIFENAPRSATCVLKEDGKIFKLDKEDFLKIQKTIPLTVIKIMQEMLNNTSDRLKKTGSFVSAMVRWGNEASMRAVTDELTGVYNRRYLDCALEEKMKEAKSKNKPLTIIMADLDYFREVNEGYSHEIGDKYIVEVANVFKKCLRKEDIIARFGGDEFTIILPDTDIKLGAEIAEKIRLSVQNLDFLKQYKGPEIKVSTSLGLASFPEHSKDVTTLKQLADQALYDAKESGRNRVVCYENAKSK